MNRNQSAWKIIDNDIALNLDKIDVEHHREQKRTITHNKPRNSIHSHCDHDPLPAIMIPYLDIHTAIWSLRLRHDLPQLRLRLSQRLDLDYDFCISAMSLT
jgi:hypothetical protein